LSAAMPVASGSRLKQGRPPIQKVLPFTIFRLRWGRVAPERSRGVARDFLARFALKISLGMRDGFAKHPPSNGVEQPEADLSVTLPLHERFGYKICDAGGGLRSALRRV